MTTMIMPATREWGQIQELIDSMGLTVVSRNRTAQRWTIEFVEDLNPGQKQQFEARLEHTVSGIDWLP